MKRFYIPLFISVLFPLHTHADTIFFKNGTRLDVPEVWEENGQIQCDLYGETASYHKADILRIEKTTIKDDGKGVGQTGGDTKTSEELIKYYQDALKNNPSDKTIRKNLNILTLHTEAHSLAKNGLWQQAIDKEKQALKLDPEHKAIKESLASLYNSYGVDLKNRGNLDEALDTMLKALVYAPHEPQVEKNIAVIYVDMAHMALGRGDYIGCESFLENAARFNDRNPHIYIISGRIAYNSNNYDKAQNDWSKALQLDPGLNEVRGMLDKLKKEKSLEDGFAVKETFNFSIKFEGSDNREMADAVLDILRDAYRDVGRDFDLYPDSAISVIIYPQSGLKQLDYFPDWAAGTYDGKIRIGQDLWKKQLHMKAVLYHEYAHVLARILGGSAVPFWLNEGLAEYETRELKKPSMRNERQKLLFSASGTGKLLILGDITNTRMSDLSSLSAQSIELMYAQSESFVAYLIDRYSLRDVRDVLISLGKGDSIQRAVKEVLLEDLEVLEQNWQNRFSQNPS